MSGPGDESSRVAGWPMAVATGLLLVLCFPPFSNPVAPFVALVPLAVAVERVPRRDSRAAARLGLVAGVVAWGGLVSWIPAALSPLTGLAVPLYAVAVAFLSSFVALFAWTAHRLRHRVGFPLWLAVPVGWTAAEWLRAHAGPLSIPWLELGVSMSSRPRLAGAAELVGSRGLGFWLTLVSGSAAAAFVARGRRRVAAVVGGVVVAMLPAAWGFYRFDTLRVEPLMTVSILQPNLDREARAAGNLPARTLARLGDLLAQVPGDVDLVVWPEAVFTHDPRRDPALAAAISDLVDGVGTPVLFGVYLQEDRGRADVVTFNGALVWLPGTGDSGYAYRKRRLVPGIEAIPFIDPARPGMSGRFAAFGRGRTPGVLELPGVPPLTPLICYESIFSANARAGALGGGRVLVNLTNDAWLGGGDGRVRTPALYQHPAHLTLRAIELRQGAVRAANTGVSEVVDPRGLARSSTDVFVPAVLTATVLGAPGATLYARFGDWPGVGCALVTVVCLVGQGWVRRRSRGHVGSR